MTGVPTWMSSSAVAIVRTMNGFAIVQTPSSAVSESVSFETWAALAFYLEANFAVTPSA